MVTLAKLDTVLNQFDGTAIKDGSGTPMTVRKVLVNELGGYTGQKVSGDSLIKAYELGLKIHGADDATEVDTDQLKFIKAVLSENPLYLSIVMGQVLKYLDEAKDEAAAKEKAAKEVKESKKEAAKPLTD